MIPLEIQTQPNINAIDDDIIENQLIIVPSSHDDFYHTKCGTRLFCSKSDILSKTFQTGNKKKVCMIVSSVMVPWLLCNVTQSIINYYFLDIPFLATLHLILYGGEHSILVIGQLLFLFSFNIKLFKYQLSQFEVLYKFYLFVVCIIGLSLEKAQKFHAQDFSAFILGVIGGVQCFIITTCIDAAKVNYIAKIIFIFIAILVFTILEIEQVMLYFNSNQFDSIIIFNIEFNGYILVRHGIETLLIFLTKQFVVTIYRYAIKREYNKSIAIKKLVIVDWYCPVYPRYKMIPNHNNITVDIADTKHEILLLPIATPAMAMVEFKNERAPHVRPSNLDTNFFKSKIIAYAQNDIYHRYCCIKILRMKQRRIDKMSDIFQSKKIISIAIIVFILYFILSLIAFFNNNSNNKQTLTVTICNIIRNLLLIIFQILILLSWNIKLIKLQLVNFETNYKIVNAMIIITCEILYIIHSDDYKTSSSSQKQLLIIENVLYFICIFIGVIGVSYIDTWCIDSIYKIIYVLLVMITLIYWFIITIYQRAYQDYPMLYIIRQYNIYCYYVERSAFGGLIVYSIKNFAILIYYTILQCLTKKKNYYHGPIRQSSTRNLMIKSVQAISTFNNAIILWKDDLE